MTTLSNIFLLASLKSNQKTYQTDTLEYMMANNKGECWERILGIKESKLYWKRMETQFCTTFIFETKQANRKIGQIKGDKKLFGIVSFGLSIERISNE